MRVLRIEDQPRVVRADGMVEVYLPGAMLDSEHPREPLIEYPGAGPHIVFEDSGEDLDEQLSTHQLAGGTLLEVLAAAERTWFAV